MSETFCIAEITVSCVLVHDEVDYVLADSIEAAGGFTAMRVFVVFCRLKLQPIRVCLLMTLGGSIDERATPV